MPARLLQTLNPHLSEAQGQLSTPLLGYPKFGHYVIHPLLDSRCVSTRQVTSRIREVKINLLKISSEHIPALDCMGVDRAARRSSDMALPVILNDTKELASEHAL